MCVCVCVCVFSPDLNAQCTDRCLLDAGVCDCSQLFVEHYGPHHQPLLRLLPVRVWWLDQDQPHTFWPRSMGHVRHDVAGESAGYEECHWYDLPLWSVLLVLWFVWWLALLVVGICCRHVVNTGPTEFEGRERERGGGVSLSV